MRRGILIVFTWLLACAAPAAAAPHYEIGIGEQQAHMFSDPRFKALELPHARVVVPYDVACRPSAHRRYLDVWLAAAEQAGVRPLVAFGIAWKKSRRWKLPSYTTYLRCFRAFRKRWPQVWDFNPWNEANHSAQPTFRHPRKAAGFYNAMRRACPRCQVAAGDLLDWFNLGSWLERYRPYLRGRPRIWSMHNYIDVNRPRPWLHSATRELLRRTRGRVWITETAGVVHSRRYADFDEERAAEATHRMFAFARRSPRIERVYAYQWQASCDRDLWDSAWIRADGSTRPAYRVIVEELARARGVEWDAAAALDPSLGEGVLDTCVGWTPSAAAAQADGCSDADRAWTTETLNDWVSFGDQVSVYRVVEVAGVRATVELERTLWRRPGAPRAPRRFSFHAGAPSCGDVRLEPGRRYLAPLTRRGSWFAWGDGSLLLDGDRLIGGVDAGEPTFAHHALQGLRVPRAGRLIRGTAPYRAAGATPGARPGAALAARGPGPLPDGGPPARLLAGRRGRDGPLALDALRQARARRRQVRRHDRPAAVERRAVAGRRDLRRPAHGPPPDHAGHVRGGGARPVRLRPRREPHRRGGGALPGRGAGAQADRARGGAGAQPRPVLGRALAGRLPGGVRARPRQARPRRRPRRGAAAALLAAATIH